jgi:AcrR family transcriptional regulator
MTSERSQARRVRNSLTHQEILVAAERVAALGIDALTIRAVATELRASPMALYRYFETKDALIDALVDGALGRIAPLETTDDWRHDLAEFARAHRAVLENNSWAVIPLFSHPNPGPNAHRIGADAFAILARGRVVGDDAFGVFGAILALNYGWSAFGAGRAAIPVEYGTEAHYERALGYIVNSIHESKG